MIPIHDAFLQPICCEECGEPLVPTESGMFATCINFHGKLRPAPKSELTRQKYAITIQGKCDPIARYLAHGYSIYREAQFIRSLPNGVHVKQKGHSYWLVSGRLHAYFHTQITSLSQIPADLTGYSIAIIRPRVNERIALLKLTNVEYKEPAKC